MAHLSRKMISSVVQTNTLYSLLRAGSVPSPFSTSMQSIRLERNTSDEWNNFYKTLAGFRVKHCRSPCCYGNNSAKERQLRAFFTHRFHLVSGLANQITMKKNCDPWNAIGGQKFHGEHPLSPWNFCDPNGLPESRKPAPRRKIATREV